MNFKKFVVYTFLGSLPWCFALAYGGVLLGENWKAIQAVVRQFDLLILGIILLVVFYTIYRERHALRELGRGKSGK
jgi:membrane protein DedA with SNARE-associated domain